MVQRESKLVGIIERDYITVVLTNARETSKKANRGEGERTRIICAILLFWCGRGNTGSECVRYLERILALPSFFFFFFFYSPYPFVVIRLFGTDGNPVYTEDMLGGMRVRESTVLLRGTNVYVSFTWSQGYDRDRVWCGRGASGDGRGLVGVVQVGSSVAVAGSCFRRIQHPWSYVIRRTVV